MANTVINKVVYPRATQMFLRSNLVADRIANARFLADLRQGYQVVFPYVNTVQVQEYNYSGVNVIQNSTFTTDGYAITQKKSATAQYDPLQNDLIQDPTWQNMVANEMGYQLARNIDQFALQTGIDNAGGTVAAGTPSVATVLNTLATVDATLTVNQARPGMRYIVVDPFFNALLPQMDATYGYNKADEALVTGMNGYVGRSSVGLYIFSSNNLPFAVTISLATNPTAGQVFSIYGVTFTFVTTGTAAAAGDISLGANAAATQTNLKNALNYALTNANGSPSATPGASTFIALSAENNAKINQAQLVCGAFTTNVAALTGYGRMQPSTNATNAVFGTETYSMLAGVVGAVDLTVQVEPFVEELPSVQIGSASHAKQLLATTQFGAGVFYRDQGSLVEVTANALAL